ncbi:conserved exported hypothetical protein [Nitrosotalea sinensis]|uniref:Uncharacterized protein n=1 Tax=Nitrosotalea sinensis TaxID=1499975 RepID=A0A2H1EIF8_9ARCH|nr:hypothetical protein [Candidatus Nitrosotalea sinensis]SHO47542.1 conserved exported hypothetical protein [Candidatus Nitrosotalea sinensis]
MSDIRLIMIGAAIIFGGFVVGGIGNSGYSQYAIQQQNFDDCYDYSSGIAMHVKCSDKSYDHMLYLLMSLALLGVGGIVMYKGIRGKWDHDVKDNEMLGPEDS